MSDQQLSGAGDVYVKRTRELLGHFEYVLQTTTPKFVGHITARIDLDLATAGRTWRDGKPLVLQLNDGRYLDFYVTHIDPNTGSVDVTVAGAIRSEW